MALRTFGRFPHTLGVKLKKTKTYRCQRIIFLGLRGDFPTPANKMPLGITLPEEQARTWAATIQRILTDGFIPHAELKSVIGRLFYPNFRLREDRQGNDGAPLFQTTGRPIPSCPV